MAVWTKKGNGLPIAGTGWPKVAALSSDTVAFIDSYLKELRTYVWNGTDWVSGSSPLAITSEFDSALVALTSTRVAAVDAGNDDLRMYELSGGTWSLLGNVFSPGFVSNTGCGLARVSDTEVAFVDGALQVLRTFAFDGTNWSQVGNGLTVSSASSGTVDLVALSPGIVAYTQENLDRIRTYSWDGSDWAQVGNEGTLFNTNPGLAALSASRVVIANEDGDRLQHLDWDGTDWTLAENTDWFSFPAAIELPSITALTGSLIAFVDFGDTELTTYGFSLTEATVSVQLADTEADFVQIGGDLIATLEDTTASASGTVVITGSLSAALANTRATFKGEIRRWSVEETLASDTSDDIELSWVQKLSLAGLGTTPVATFYNPKQEVTLSAIGSLELLAAYVKDLTLAGTATVTDEARTAAAQWLLARGVGSLETDLQRLFEATLQAVLGDEAIPAFAALASEVGQASESAEVATAAQLMDSLSADLLGQTTMIVAVNETLGAEAGDEVQALGHYIANVNDLAGAWLVFKASGEVVQGWVMNVEGDRPFSEYRGFEFNSMTKIGDAYFGASDDGLYALTGDTDANEPISAKLGSMMLDFDTSAQKRVVAAYLGYTSDGTVVLKVRSVDQGKLVEHWYTATEVTADAPREAYQPLGRGLKSRYWQFEIENVDGADFEIDKLELQPIKLRRRT